MITELIDILSAHQRIRERLIQIETLQARVKTDPPSEKRTQVIKGLDNELDSIMRELRGIKRRLLT